MKDIDTLLSQHTPKPKRELANNFTQTVILETRGPQRLQHRKHFWKSFGRRLHTVPGIAVLLIILGTGGFTSYAVTSGWLDNTEGATVTTAPSDPTIITVDLNHCSIPWMTGGGLTYEAPSSATKIENGPVQFKILQPQKVTADDVRNSVLAFCEAQSVLQFYHATYTQWFPAAASTPYGPNFGKIVSVQSDSITVNFTLDGQSNTITYPTTSALPMYQDGKPISASTLQAGDNALFIINQPSDFSDPNWRPTTPTASNSSLASLSLMQYDFADDDFYGNTNMQIVEPLELYTKGQAEQQALDFYRKTDPTWFPATKTSTPYAPDFGKIGTITSTQITVLFPWQGSKDISVTYPIQSNLTVYYNGKTVPLGELHTGDHALIIVDQPADFDSPNYWPAKPSPSNSTLASIDKMDVAIDPN